MAYNYEIGLVVLSTIREEFDKHVNTQPMLKLFLEDSDEYIEKDGCRLWHWDSRSLGNIEIVKEFEGLQRYANEHYDDVLLVAVGEELYDCEVYGWCENPFDAGLVREFRFTDTRTKEERKASVS